MAHNKKPAILLRDSDGAIYEIHLLKTLEMSLDLIGNIEEQSKPFLLNGFDPFEQLEEKLCIIQDSIKDFNSQLSDVKGANEWI